MKDFTADFFSVNRHKLRTTCKNNQPIVITANGLVQRAGDSAFAFRQDSNFWYLTGIELPDAVLVITENSEFLILPERDAVLDYFDGAIDRNNLRTKSGIQQIVGNHEGWEQLIQLLTNAELVNLCLYKGYDQRHALYLNPSKARLVSRIKKIAPKAEFNDIRLNLTHLRMIKQSQEIAAIQNSVNISVSAFKSVFSSKWYTRHKHEAAVNAALTYEFMKAGATNAYPSIVAGGKRACTLHYCDNNQPIAKNELLLIDAGAEYGNYAADVTRVYAPTKMSIEQQKVYSAVKDVQDYAFSLLKPGADIRKIDTKVEKRIGAFLKAEKLITKQETAQIRKYYPHAVSHHLGLDVHDAADYSLKLAVGMVITIEPGIYIPEKAIGVRIEDDILITADGYKNLSASLPS